MKSSFTYFAFPLAALLLTGCAAEESSAPAPKVDQAASQETPSAEKTEEKQQETTPADPPSAETAEAEATESVQENKSTVSSENESFPGYTPIEVDGGDLSGDREPNVVVNIGFGDREYWAFTNEHAQLVKVTAKKITLQQDTEDVTSSGRYYSDEAKVPGVESPQLDEGHVIADSLGGVSNAYNITPQDSTLNRHGDQAYMENSIRQAGDVTDFEAIITYPDSKTQIPSHYRYTYTLKGNVIVDDFDNVSPDEVNAALGLTEDEDKTAEATVETAPAPDTGDVSTVDTDGNGQVTIQEAKDAGFAMPITEDHWLYPHMRDNDHDGMVGE
ncbi:DNA/RNA non-specific endonuclease [Exiguobacterium artemiae]|uniref:DNA/RNA non-specific endonuclease n=1 Tax=Exiguobacterium artemiae TaxID=340145 RepID=UPI0029648B8D|nr:DNA/RNA non-specific endonuclease [Exiguobacterium sibiricum]MDW2884615.1 DNA/RNA non-specific endonuclease [Exiguobacterium sibiricum]